MNSQKYAQETALSRRVKEWEDGINPHLAAQVMWDDSCKVVVTDCNVSKMFSMKKKYSELLVAV